MAQHVTTLAAFISGIVGSKSSQLPSIATKIADQAKAESRVKRLSRWLDNEHIKEEIYFLPYAEILLTCLALETLVWVMDVSGVGRGCSARARSHLHSQVSNSAKCEVAICFNRFQRPAL